jgi:hypothetical protein
MEIEGVKPEPVSAKPSAASASEIPQNSASPTPSHIIADPATTTAPAKGINSAIAHGTPLDEEDGNGECNLLGDFALIVQGALGLLAVSSLAVKRWREHPRRPVKIWFFDASKQVFGSVLLHLANVLMSMLSSGKFDVAATAVTVKTTKGDQPNPCSFYLLNLAIDVSTTSPVSKFPANPPRQPSESPSSSSSSKSSTAAPSSHLSPTPPSPSDQATTATPLTQHGGSSNPSSTSSACSS